MLKYIYIVLAGGILAFYGAGEYFGWEFFNPPRRVEAADSHRSPGWSHHVTAHHFYSGFRGGK
jgi:hypothetical protein